MLASSRSALRAASRRTAQAARALQQADYSTPAAPPAPDLVPVIIDGKQAMVPRNISVLQACESVGVDVPRFCFHHRLSIAGNCRMCLVEIVKSPKPQASCAMPVMPNMEIKTNTPVVKKAREGVMEFLLINHPLDCPICDQGGECDLQDQAFVYGSDRSRFTESKRSVEDKNLGPLVKTVMTRCIHCTRCVRFAKEIAGIEDLGVTGRGNASEIGTYVNRLMTSELSGNVIDICPVGALTSKPYAFTARPWELKATESVDVLDALGSNIRVDSRGTEVMRIVPRLHEDVNEEWISDKTRFAYDGLKRQRLMNPMAKVDGKLQNVTWEEALALAAEKLTGAPAASVKAVAGKLADAEAIVALKDFMARLGAGNLALDGVPAPDADIRSSYLFNTSIARVEDADFILIVGSNPRAEAPVLNARIRRAAIAAAVPVAVVGPKPDLTYPAEHIGDAAALIDEIASGKHAVLEKLKAAKTPLVIVGAELLRRPDSVALLSSLHTLADKAGVVKPGWNGYSVLHDAGGRVAALDLGFVPSPSAASAPPPKVVYLLGADDFSAADVPADAFVIYQGSHGDAGAARADLILPGAAYTEKPATYVNTEGRPQMAHPAVTPIGNAREDWKIVRALSEAAGAALPYDTLKAVRARLAQVSPTFARVDDVQASLWLNGSTYAHHKAAPAAAKKGAEPLKSIIDNFYMTDAITRASQIMARATAARKAGLP